MLKLFAMVGIGSGIGGMARYAVSLWMNRLISQPGPWGTLTVNLLGCLLIGFLSALFARHTSLSEQWRVLLTVGFCGGFTTFSTFVNESHALLADHRSWLMLLYAVGSFAIGLIALQAGRSLAEFTCSL